MTIAERFQAKSERKWRTWDELLINAEKLCDITEQDYENELTYFEFVDNSVAVFDGKGKTITVRENA